MLLQLQTAYTKTRTRSHKRPIWKARRLLCYVWIRVRNSMVL